MKPAAKLTIASIEEHPAMEDFDPIESSMVKGNQVHESFDDTAEPEVSTKVTKPKSGKYRTLKILSLVFGSLLLIFLLFIGFIELSTSAPKNTNFVDPTRDFSAINSTNQSGIEKPAREVANRGHNDNVVLPSHASDMVMTGDDIVLDSQELSQSMRSALYGETQIKEDFISAVEATPEPIDAQNGLSQDNQFASLISKQEDTGKSIETIQGQIQTISNQIIMNTEMAESNQRAITQSAQLLVSIRDTINDANKEIIRLRNAISSSDERILKIENNVRQIQGGSSGTATSRDTAPIKSTSNPNDTLAYEQPRLTQPTAASSGYGAQSGVDQSLVSPAATRIVDAPKPVLIHQLRVFAVHANKAVVLDANDAQYLLQAGESYKNLGQVNSIDLTEGKVYGRFENGVNWVIEKRAK